MANFAIVVSDPESRKSYQTVVDQNNAVTLVGKKIGEEFPGDVIGLNGYSLKVTGGSDKNGFPMHPAFPGQGRRKELLIKKPGHHPTKQGERRRKTIRGSVISQDIAQINCKVVKKGERALEEVFGKKEEKVEGGTSTEKSS